LTDDERVALTAGGRRLIEDDKFPRAGRLDPLRSAMTKFDAAPKLTPEPQLPTPPVPRGGKRARR
jgi:hypothetical protein